MIAAAAIEQNCVVLGADQPGMDAGDDAVGLRVVVIGNEPAAMLIQHRAIQSGNELFRRKRGKTDLLFHPRYAYIADHPGCHSIPLRVARACTAITECLHRTRSFDTSRSLPDSFCRAILHSRAFKS